MSEYLRHPGPVDEISQDSGMTIPGLSRARTSPTPGAKLTALTTALAVVLTGGVVTAAWRAFQPTHAPEQLVPSTAFAVGTLDLGMPGGQADALAAFADHFPSSPTHHGDGSAVDRLLRAIMRESSDPHVNYDRDIKPWLGDHVVLAGWTDKAGKAQMEGLVESKDDAAAKKVLGKAIAQGNGAVRFADGYAVLGDTDAVVRESIDAAHRSSIADSDGYVHDIDALPGHPAATGWMDGPAVLNAIKSTLNPDEARMFGRMGPMGAFGMLGPMGLVGAAGVAGSGQAGALGAASATFRGHTAVGVRVADRYIEIDVRSGASNVRHQSTTATLRALPASTIGALEIGDPSSLVTGMTAMFKSFAGTTESFRSSCTTTAIAPFPPASAIPLNMPHRRAILRQLAKARRAARRQGHANSACDVVPSVSANPMKELARQTGLNLPGDATTVLGDSLLASYGGLSLHGVPKVAVRTHPADLSAAQAVIDKVQNRLGGSSVPFVVDTSGDDLVLATSPEYAQAVEATGTLGEQALVKLALGDLPDTVATAGYVDLSKILPLLGDVPRDVQALKAVGFWTALDHGVELSEMRVVVG